MSASGDSTQEAGHKLIKRLDTTLGAMKHRYSEAVRDSSGKIKYIAYEPRHLQGTIKTMTYALHRLRFLEMVVTGLTYQEQRDAAQYAKFVASMRKIEDMDIQELREMLR